MNALMLGRWRHDDTALALCLAAVCSEYLGMAMTVTLIDAMALLDADTGSCTAAVRTLDVWGVGCLLVLPFSLSSPLPVLLL